MAKIQSVVTFQNLQQYSTLITDTSPTSPFYFNLSEVPDVLTGGKNSFLIAGNATSGGTKTLVAGSVIKMEILDANGNPIYLAPIPNYTEGESSVVSIEVYPGTTPPGLATLTILGQAYVDPTGTVITDPLWVDAYNLKWQKNFIVQPYAPNTTKIRFYNTPTLTVSELLGPYRVASIGAQQTISTGSVTVQAIGLNSPSYLYPPQTVLIASGFSFSSSMANATFSAFVSGLPFTTSISEVFNSGTVFLSQSLTGSNGLPYTFTTTTFSLQFYPTISYATTAATRSYAQAVIGNLETFSGEVARAKLYYLSLDQPGNWSQIADISVEENELTATESLATANLEQRMGYISNQSVLDTYWEVGPANHFSSASYAYFPVYPGYPISASYVNDHLIDAGRLSASSSAIGVYSYWLTTYLGEPLTWVGINQDLPFIAGQEYTLSGTFFGKVVADPNSITSPFTSMSGRMDIFLYGPAFPSGGYGVTGSDPIFGQSLASLQIPSGTLIPNSYLSASVGEKLFTIDKNFIAPNSGTARLRFVVWGGSWHWQGVGIFAGSDDGFNANQVETLIPMPASTPRFSQLQFKTELYDVNNNMVPLDIEYGPVQFTGANVVLQGTDHQVQGQLAVVPSGTTSQYPLRLAATGFNFSGSFVSGSAFMLGSGNFAANDTPILIGADITGSPYVSLGNNLVAYNVPGAGFQMVISGNLTVQGTASFASISNYVNYAMLSGTSVNDGAGAASAVSRYQSYQVQNNQAVTFTTAFQSSPRVEFSKIQFYEPRAKWGTLSQVTLQSGNTTAFATGSPARDNTSATNLTAVGCTAQVVIAQPGAANGTSTVFTVTLGQPPTEYGGIPGPPINVGSASSATPLPATSPSNQYTWGYASGSGSEGTPEDGWGITSYLQFSPDQVTWTTIDTITYTVNGQYAITIPSAQHTITSTVPTSSTGNPGWFRVELQTNVEPNSAVVGGYYVQWGSSSVASQYASMAILTGSDAQYVTMEVFTKS